ncbi:MAG TPA: DUF47 family protein [Anaerolineae bacterium]|nr:DUF47 family protein [Anaerolineae bacterium]
MGLRDLFKPRQDKFLKLLIGQASKTLEGMEALEDYMKDGSEEAAKRVVRAEKEADELRRILIEELNRTFVTPFDREDIFALSRIASSNGFLPPAAKALLAFRDTSCIFFRNTAFYLPEDVVYTVVDRPGPP